MSQHALYSLLCKLFVNHEFYETTQEFRKIREISFAERCFVVEIKESVIC